MLSLLPHLLLPLLWLVAGLLYLRRATRGLERHLLPISISFFAIFASIISSGLRRFFSSSPRPDLAALASPFNILWFAEHLLLIVGIIIIARWVFSYLLKQFHTQVFILFTTSIVVIFLVTGLTFSTLLIKSLQTEKIASLQSGSQLVSNLIAARQEELLATAQTIAQNPALASALSASDSSQIVSISQSFLLRQKATAVTVTDNTFKVLMRAHQPEKYGDTLPASALTARLTAGQSAANLQSLSSPTPTVLVQAAAPIPNAAGFVFVEDALDNTFLDRLRATSGLAVSIYIDNRLAATSLTGPDNLTRPIGLPAPQKTFPWSGQISLLGVPYLGAFAPLNDIDSNTVALLFIGTPAASLTSAAGSAIQISFILAVALLVISLLPAYLVSKYISHQV